MKVSDPNYEKTKKRYSTFVTISIVLLLIHLLGMILVQTFTKYDEVNAIYTYVPVSGINYASSSLALILSSQGDFTKQVAIPASVISVALGVLFFGLLYGASKGKHYCFFGYGAVYVLDTFCIIPLFIFGQSYKIHLGIADYILTILLHLITLAVIVSGSISACKLWKSEKEVKLYNADHHDPKKGL